MALASVFSLSYFVGPFYIPSALAALALRHPSPLASYLYAAPLLLSAVLPPVPAPRLVRRLLRPMLSYFDYEEVVESSPVDVRRQIRDGRNYLLVFQPHGVVSYGGICSFVSLPTDLEREEGGGGGQQSASSSSSPARRRGMQFPTAVADALLYTPVLKHILGVFGLISASKKSLVRALTENRGPEGCVVLYVGGMAELFLSCDKQERLYLRRRKGFIKLALEAGVDVVPVYLFGNTAVLSLLKTGLLAAVSRRLQVSLTYVWGRWYLPIPRPTKILYASGQPLGMPHIPKPTQDDVDRWHDKYCAEVKRIFDLYKERVPEYKHKQLEIL
jgi:2-acylglycerol O-acyltransferase 2